VLNDGVERGRGDAGLERERRRGGARRGGGARRSVGEKRVSVWVLYRSTRVLGVSLLPCA
jgi:hypothetical protein